MKCQPLILQGLQELLYPKGYRVIGNDGEYICTVAKDINFGDILTVDQFTEWQIPIPDVGDPAHPAIQRIVMDSYLLFYKNRKTNCQLPMKNPTLWDRLKYYIRILF